MEGAEVAVDFLARSGVDVCFVNPGTTEMNLVRAVAQHNQIRYVPTLYEGVAVGAADGYYRISGRPAMSLLHNGIGLTNALASMFNAGRAGSASLVLVGDHSDALQQHRSIMSSGVMIAEAAAATGTVAVRISVNGGIEKQLSDAWTAATRAPGAPVVVAMPYDVAWSDRAAERVATPTGPVAQPVPDERISAMAAILQCSGKIAMLLGNEATRTEDALSAAGRIAAATGCRLLSRPAVLQRGRNRVPIDQFFYSPLHGAQQLSEYQHVILVGMSTPVMPWGYPSHGGTLMTGEGTTVHVLATPAQDVSDALRRLAAEFGAPMIEAPQIAVPALAHGAATPKSVAQSLASLLPEGAIFLNEGISNGGVFQDATADSRPHTMLINVGGAIGWAQSAAIGCALAAPERKVVVVQGDGAAMYMPQALWTIAREKLDVTIVILANHKYKVLELDLQLRGISGTNDVMRIDQPTIDWVSVAQGLGVAADTANDMDEFNEKFAASVAGSSARLLVVHLQE